MAGNVMPQTKTDGKAAHSREILIRNHEKRDEWTVDATLNLAAREGWLLAKSRERKEEGKRATYVFSNSGFERIFF